MNSKSEMTWIDSAKGIAIIGMLVYHTGALSLPSYLGAFGSVDGWPQIFLIISGYLTFLSLEHLVKKAGTLDFKTCVNWFFKKLIRLMPLYYLVLIIMLVCFGGIAVYLGRESELALGNVITHFLFLFGLFPSYADNILGTEWYIGVLVIFYLLSPILYKFINSLERALFVFVCGSFLTTMFNKYIAEQLYPVDLNPGIYRSYINSYSIVARLPALLMGIVLFFLVPYIKECKVQGKRMIYFSCIFVVAILISGMAVGQNAIAGASNIVLYTVIFAIMIIAMCLDNCVLLDNRFLQSFGKYSYGIYMIHYIFILLYGKIPPVFASNYITYWLVEFIGVSVISYILARVSDKYFEKPVCGFIIRKLGL